MESNEGARIVSSNARYEQTAATDENEAEDSHRYTHTITIGEQSIPHGSRYRLLVPVLDGNELDESERIVRTAATIARAREGDLLILSLVDVPKQTPYEIITPDHRRVEAAHEATERLLGVAREAAIPANAIVELTHRSERSISDVADRHGCDGVFMPVEAGRSQRRRLLGGDAVETIVSQAETDVFVEETGTHETSPDRILLAVSGGPHSGLAIETARSLAIGSGARIDVVHSLEESATDEEWEQGATILRAAERLLQDVDRVDTHLLTVDDVTAAIVARSEAYDVTVLGAPTAGLLEQFVFGTVPDSVAQRSDNTVLMAKHRLGGSSRYHRWIAATPKRESNRSRSTFCQLNHTV